MATAVSHSIFGFSFNDVSESEQMDFHRCVESRDLLRRASPRFTEVLLHRRGEHPGEGEAKPHRHVARQLVVARGTRLVPE